MRRGHQLGSADDLRPAVPEGDDLGEAEVVALQTGGRSWEDLLSEAVGDPAADDPAAAPAEATGAAVPTAGGEIGVLVEVEVEDVAEPPAPGADGDAARPPAAAFGELISEVVLPGGRRVSRFRLPQP